jgi:hypothetical protein
MLRRLAPVLAALSTVVLGACAGSALREEGALVIELDADGAGEVRWYGRVYEPTAALARLEEAGMTGVTEAFDAAWPDIYNDYCYESLGFAAVGLTEFVNDPAFDGHDVGVNYVSSTNYCEAGVTYRWAAGEYDPDVANMIACIDCGGDWDLEILDIQIGEDGSYTIDFGLPEESSTTSSTIDPSTTTIETTTTTIVLDPYEELRNAMPGYTDEQYQMFLDEMADTFEIRIVVPTAGATSNADEVESTTHVWKLDPQLDYTGDTFAVSYAAPVTTLPEAPTTTDPATTSSTVYTGLLPATGSSNGALPYVAVTLVGLGVLVQFATRRRATEA